MVFDITGRLRVWRPSSPGDPPCVGGRPQPGAAGARRRPPHPQPAGPLPPWSRGCPTAPSRACPSRLAQRRGLRGPDTAQAPRRSQPLARRSRSPLALGRRRSTAAASLLKPRFCLDQWSSQLKNFIFVPALQPGRSSDDTAFTRGMENADWSAAECCFPAVGTTAPPSALPSTSCPIGDVPGATRGLKSHADNGGAQGILISRAYCTRPGFSIP
ncbi:PREDICTED: uncharacterized protein LOC109381242 [Hipposideros armiger]|uniref:Uncharacterized protein LOC109381242 n=1 Tax=Hipposideros armiger TaxID=186990 RepID=A0A8B7R3P0_HIPAR|nr:PREDICTED: uncharacterized protein LOC109381242 [Hipposideros armiger]